MRVLRIFHSAVVDAWRERERHLRVLGVDVDLVTARRWNEGGSDVTLVPRPGEPVRGIRTWGRHPALFVYSPLPLWRALGRDVRRDRHPRGAVRPGDGRDPAAAAAASPARAVRPVLRPEHRQAVPAAVPLARAVGPAPRRRTERLQHRGRPHLRAQGPAGVGHPDPARRGRRPLLPRPRRTRRTAPVPVVGYAGRLEPHKGVDVLLEAVARLDGGRAPRRRRRPRGGAVASPHDGARPRRSRRVRRVARPGPAPGLLPRPRRPGRPVAPDARLARAVRARGRRGHGVRRPGRRQRHRRAARRRGRGRAAGAARRPRRAGRLPRDAAEGRARPTRAGAAWGRAGPARVVVGGGARLSRPLRASGTHPGHRAPRRRGRGGRLRPAGPPGRLASAGAVLPRHGRRQLARPPTWPRSAPTRRPLPRPREQRRLRGGRQPRAGPPARPGRRRPAPQPRRGDRVRRRAAPAPRAARRPHPRVRGAHPGRRGRPARAGSRGPSRRRVAPGWSRPGSDASVAPAAS